MLKIQKLLCYFYWNTSEREVIKRYNKLKEFFELSKKDNEERQLSSLNKLLNHSLDNVPYYNELFTDLGLVKNGKLTIKSFDQFGKIPFLTKDIIREKNDLLHSIDKDERKSFLNSTGGSTGEPINFLQDREFQISNHGNSLIVKSMRGVGPYDNSVILWGSERDTFEGDKPFIEKIKDFILNIVRLNTFTMNSKKMTNYIDLLNRVQPSLIIAYVQSIYELSKFAKENKLKVKKQKAIHAAAGTVYDFMRTEIEEVFQCKVFNHYGSRDAGVIASECGAHDGLHVLMEHVLLEIIDKEGNSCKVGEEGEIVITTLSNYSMPLIRYRIGDIGVLKSFEKCSCGRNYPKLEKVVGRVTDVFKSMNGSIVGPEYFIHLIGVVCNKGNIRMFQVIQEKLDEIILKIVQQGEVSQSQLEEIKIKIQIVMGSRCKVKFEMVEEIEKTKSGKYLYTICNV